MATAVKQTYCPGLALDCPPGFSGDDLVTAWVYSLLPLVAPLSRELPAYTQLHSECRLMLGGTAPNRVPRVYTCLFFILLHSSLCSSSCLSEHESTLWIHSHGFRWNQPSTASIFFLNVLVHLSKAEKEHNSKFRSNLPMWDAWTQAESKAGHLWIQVLTRTC